MCCGWLVTWCLRFVELWLQFLVLGGAGRCFLVGFMFGGVGWLVFASGCSLWFWDAASCVDGLSWCFFGSLRGCGGY